MRARAGDDASADVREEEDFEVDDAMDDASDDESDDESGDESGDERNNHIEIRVESDDDDYDSMPDLIDDNYCYDENGVRHFAPHLNQWITAPPPGS